MTRERVVAPAERGDRDPMAERIDQYVSMPWGNAMSVTWRASHRCPSTTIAWSAADSRPSLRPEHAKGLADLELDSPDFGVRATSVGARFCLPLTASLRPWAKPSS